MSRALRLKNLKKEKELQRETFSYLIGLLTCITVKTNNMEDIKAMREVVKQLKNASKMNARQAAKVESMTKKMTKKK